MKVYQEIASKLQAIKNCEQAKNEEWEIRHREHMEEVINSYLPSGSGFDSGTTLDEEKSKPDRLVFSTAFHHMSEHGFYTRWTKHQVIVTPSLAFGFDLRVTGRDHNDIKDFIGDEFNECLENDVK